MAKPFYINNKDFLKELIAYKQAVKKAEEENLPKPKLPEYVGKCFMMIAEKLSHKPNFLSYTFRDEMIADAVENCVMYADSFDPIRSSNPFAYFTQTVYNAFLRRIKKEKKQLYVKYKSTIAIGILEEYETSDAMGDDGTYKQFEVYDNIALFVENFEKTIAEKKTKTSVNKTVDDL